MKKQFSVEIYGVTYTAASLRGLRSAVAKSRPGTILDPRHWAISDGAIELLETGMKFDVIRR